MFVLQNLFITWLYHLFYFFINSIHEHEFIINETLINCPVAGELMWSLDLSF